MAGKVDAFGANAGPPRDFDVDQGQRDRNAGPQVEHLVEAAVARILVLLAVAAEALLVEQVPLSVSTRAASGASCPGSAAMRWSAASPIWSSRSRYGPGSRCGYSIAREQERRRGEVGAGAVRGVGQLLGERRGGEQHTVRSQSGIEGVERQCSEAGHDQLGVRRELVGARRCWSPPRCAARAARADSSPHRESSMATVRDGSIAWPAARSRATPRDTDPAPACSVRSDRRRRRRATTGAARPASAFPRSRG